MFAQIYEGCLCGETWRVTEIPVIDDSTEHVEDALICDICGQLVTAEKKADDGTYLVHLLTEEEMDAELYWSTPDADDSDDEC